MIKVLCYEVAKLKSGTVEICMAFGQKKWLLNNAATLPDN
jgi:hypothetical protein